MHALLRVMMEWEFWCEADAIGIAGSCSSWGVGTSGTKIDELEDESKSKAHDLHDIDEVTDDGDECPAEELVLDIIGCDEVGSWKAIKSEMAEEGCILEENTFSSKRACLVIKTRWETGSRHRKPL
jgi:hypothetical protein